jgi:hypothetical protein
MVSRSPSTANSNPIDALHLRRGKAVVDLPLRRASCQALLRQCAVWAAAIVLKLGKSRKGRHVRLFFETNLTVDAKIIEAKLNCGGAFTGLRREHGNMPSGHNIPEAYVRFGSLADICSAKGHVRFAPNSNRESGFPANGHVRFTPESGHVRCN